MRIGMTCYPSVGGSGILASALGEALARRGHQVHFISYERPVRLPKDVPGIHFHPVVINDYGLFKYPDYTLPLSVKMAEVAREERLEILHVHYAVPHATAAILARSMLPAKSAPRIVTTLHGTDTTLLGRDPGYAPAVRHALLSSDAVTTVSQFLSAETRRLLGFEGPIRVIHNFFAPRVPCRSREEVRRQVGVGDETLLIHSSNLRPLKRIDVLLMAAARLQNPFRLLILAGDAFSPYQSLVEELGLRDRISVVEKPDHIEDYLNAADIGVTTSDTESFCLSILEAMYFACPSVASRVGGIPEVLEEGKSGLLFSPGDPSALADQLDGLMADETRRRALGQAGQVRAHRYFSRDVIVPQYEALYRSLLSS